MKRLLADIFLAVAVIVHIGMLWNLSAHFRWQSGFPPEWLPQKTGAAVPAHWGERRAEPELSGGWAAGFARRWADLKKNHVSSRELIRVPVRQTDNFGLDLLLRDANNTDPGGDFFQLVRSGHDVRQGTSIYQNYPPDMDPALRKLLDETTPFHPPNRYPPAFAFTIGLALSHLKPWTAYLMWVILHELVLVYCIILSRKPAAGSRVRFRIAAAMWLGFLPWYLELYMGQTTFIIMAATFVLGVHLDGYAGGFKAGLWWTASLVTKPISLLFAPVLLSRRKFAMLFFGLSVAAGSSWLYFRHHPADARLFLTWMSGQEMVLSLGNYGFQALLYRIHMSDTGTWIIGGLLVLTGLYLSLRRREVHSTRLIVIWICIYFLGYTHVWQHHLVLFLPAVILPWLYSGRLRYIAVWLLAAMPSTFYLFNNQWTWLREIIYLSGASLPVMLLLFDQLFLRTLRAPDGETVS